MSRSMSVREKAHEADRFEPVAPYGGDRIEFGGGNQADNAKLVLGN